ncbi:hypothetical protein [Lentilactobacillus parafarraginis]|nr:hypothetical protein [Lentilactobacillus parafarraginis]
MLKIKDLNLTVHHQQILQKMTIDFQPGNVYGIIGPTGLGKPRCSNQFLASLDMPEQ